VYPIKEMNVLIASTTGLARLKALHVEFEDKKY
jgi:hypothetical protein